MIKYDEWKISASGYQVHAPQFLESIFSQANGYLGSRAAFFQDGALPFERCTYMAGGFDYISPGISDIVNLPDPFHFHLTIAGSVPGQKGGNYRDFNQTLNLNNGLHVREAVWVDEHGRKTALKISRFISMADKHIAALSIELTALNFDSEAELLLGLDASVVNLPIHDDQMFENVDTVKMLNVISKESKNNACSLLTESRSGRLRFNMRFQINHSGGFQADASTADCPARKITMKLKQNEVFRIEKLISINAPYEHINGDFNSLLSESAKVWELRWQMADIIVESDNHIIQPAIRYNIFQLIQNQPFNDANVSIGARGLTHSRYKGCYFWDTEIFILPFFLYTDPSAARNLMRFRLNTLPDAFDNAKALSLHGARYPWMCAIGGKEQCFTWDTGRSEIHITADIVYAMDKYILITGDKSLDDEITKLYIETARYWASRFSYDKRYDVYNLLFVKGPDEYCGVSSNNAFTVMMARHNLELAIKYTEKKDIVSEAEINKWRDIIAKSQVGYDAERKLYLQDDDFLRLEPFDFSGKTGETPLYKNLDFDRLQRYQVLKQADLVLLILLLPELFTDEQKQAIWDCYEPLTLHDSSLSYGIHAWAAALLNKWDKAYGYFYKSLFLDLENILDNTGNEGIHMAALGATWQALVFGFAGLSFDPAGTPLLSPNMPDEIEGMRFSFMARGKRYQAEIKKNDYTIRESQSDS